MGCGNPYLDVEFREPKRSEDESLAEARGPTARLGGGRSHIFSVDLAIADTQEPRGRNRLGAPTSASCCARRPCAVEDDLRNYVWSIVNISPKTQLAEVLCYASEVFEMPFQRSG